MWILDNGGSLFYSSLLKVRRKLENAQALGWLQLQNYISEAQYAYMKKMFPVFRLLICIIVVNCNIYAQDQLYPNTFPLQDVTLLNGPFKHARDLNLQTLLKYDVDRLLAGYRKEAGLVAKAAIYPNWDGLDGHVGGHHLSALAMNSREREKLITQSF